VKPSVGKVALFVTVFFFVAFSKIGERHYSTDGFSMFKSSIAAPPSSEDLERVEKQIEIENDEQARLKKKAENLSKEVVSTREEMVEVASSIQDYEDNISKIEERVNDLRGQQKKLEDQLGTRHVQMTEVLSALQNLAWRPTEAIIVQPTTPVDTVRSAILLREAVPQIEQSATYLRNDLQQINSIKRKVDSEYKRIADNRARLKNKHLKLKELFAQKSVLQKRFEEQSVEAGKRATALAGQAKDIRDLLQKLEEERKRQEAERLEKIRIAKEKAHKEAIAKGQKLAAIIQDKYKDIEASRKPKNSFKKAMGAIPYPVRGSIVTRYGEKNSLGSHAKGITLQTRTNAQVTAPYDGTVLFAGPFRGYGQLLIIGHGDGYHTLLAGMNKIDATVGQSLFAGEPVGSMSGSEKNPMLYIELRRDGQPVNPEPWLAKKGNKVG